MIGCSNIQCMSPDVDVVHVTVDDELHHTKLLLEEANMRALKAEARQQVLERERDHVKSPRKPIRIYMDGCVSPRYHCYYFTI